VSPEHNTVVGFVWRYLTLPPVEVKPPTNVKRPHSNSLPEEEGIGSKTTLPSGDPPPPAGSDWTFTVLFGIIQLTSMPRGRSGVEERPGKNPAAQFQAGETGRDLLLRGEGPAGDVIFVSGQVARDVAGETEVKSLVSPELMIEIEAIAVTPA
jgi:hypothetical protein